MVLSLPCTINTQYEIQHRRVLWRTIFVFSRFGLRARYWIRADCAWVCVRRLSISLRTMDEPVVWQIRLAHSQDGTILLVHLHSTMRFATQTRWNQRLRVAFQLKLFSKIECIHEWLPLQLETKEIYAASWHVLSFSFSRYYSEKNPFQVHTDTPLTVRKPKPPVNFCDEFKIVSVVVSLSLLWVAARWL